MCAVGDEHGVVAYIAASNYAYAAESAATAAAFEVGKKVACGADAGAGAFTLSISTVNSMLNSVHNSVCCVGDDADAATACASAAAAGGTTRVLSKWIIQSSDSFKSARLPTLNITVTCETDAKTNFIQTRMNATIIILFHWIWFFMLRSLFFLHASRAYACFCICWMLQCHSRV